MIKQSCYPSRPFDGCLTKWTGIFLIILSMTMSVTSCCKNPETAAADARAVESLYSEAIQTIDTVTLDYETRIKIADIRRRAEILWLELKSRYGSESMNPWVKLAAILAREVVLEVSQ